MDRQEDVIYFSNILTSEQNSVLLQLLRETSGWEIGYDKRGSDCIIIDDPIILDTDDEDSELDDDTTIGEPTVGDVTGDPTVTDITSVVDDPNNIITIDDFTPETDPSRCS